MNTSVRNICLLAFAGLLTLHTATAEVAGGSKSAPPRLNQKIDGKSGARLQGNVRQDLVAHRDLGPVEDSLERNHIYLTLRRSPERQTAVLNLIERQQQKGTLEYHRWLTPDQVGEKFGVAQQDIAAISKWLESQGFHVNHVARNGVTIDFSGTAKTIADAFHTDLHYYDVDGKKRFANAQAPQIPSALTGIVAGIVGLDNFPPVAAHTRPQQAQFDSATHKFRHARGANELSPAYSDTLGDYLVAPEDFYTIYSANPLFTAGIKGTGATVAVIEESDFEYGTVNPDTGAATGGDLTTFRSIFGVNAVSSKLNFYVYHGYGNDTCSDPGIDPNSSEEDVEASIDAEWASAAAPAATLIFMSCDDVVDDGIFSSLQALVDNNLSDVMSMSYGESELDAGHENLYSFIDPLYQQAALQGQSIIVSSGDAGSDTADQNTSGTAARGLNVSALSSSPYATSAGGTDFSDTYDDAFGGPAPSTYWGANNNPYYGSSFGYVPETAWASSCAGSLTTVYYGYTGAEMCALNEATSGYVIGGGGGYSTNYSIPSYQSSFPGLSGTQRAQPDIAMFASSGWWGHGLLFCDSNSAEYGNAFACDTPADFGEAGGTSFVAPQVAGIAGLVVSYTGERQGALNYGLYALAKNQFTASATQTACYANGQTANTGVTTGLPAASCIFNDVTTGNNDVPCAAGSTNCYVDSGADYGMLSTTNAASLTVAYPAGAGYDLATGLGSLNINNLVTKWKTTGGAITTTTTLTATPNPVTAGSSAVLGATVTASSGTPIGNVTFKYGSDVLGSCSLSNGSCTFSASSSGIPLGTYGITASYSGSSGFNASISALLDVAITGKGATRTTLTAAPTSIKPPNDVALAATVVRSGSTGVPTGSVTFYYLTDALGTASLNSAGVATFSASSKGIPTGSYAITAKYNGDAEDGGSTSSPVSVTVQ